MRKVCAKDFDFTRKKVKGAATAGTRRPALHTYFAKKCSILLKRKKNMSFQIRERISEKIRVCSVGKVFEEN